MPQMPQVRVPRLVVALMLLGLFFASLLAARLYGLAGQPEALAIAIAAGVACILTTASLIRANYERYHIARTNGRLNGSP